MKPIEPPEYMSTFILARINSVGIFEYCLTGAINGYYPSREAAQQQQILEILKDNHYHLFELEIPIKH